MNLPASLFSGGLLLLLLVAPVSGQGTLTPPGAPAATMKTLDQIEPRIPISTLPFTILSSGHYYLTRSLTSTTDGIKINADDVTIDLGGFTLTGDGGSGDIGIEVLTGHTRIRVRGGRVVNFAVGVSVAVNTSELLLEDLHLHGNSSGLLANSTNVGGTTRSVFRRLRVTDSLGFGISFGNSSFTGVGQNLIEQCELVNNAGIGLNVSTTGNLILRCLASGNTPNYNIVIGNRFGAIVAPAASASTVSGSSGGAGTGTTDPFANLSF
ncbi:MAG: hypothetical protein JSR82_12755 [Verrucomicrobia bacterium]|nr:hypothetical protein [Verrucomicrobiota bacterium]